MPEIWRFVSPLLNYLVKYKVILFGILLFLVSTLSLYQVLKSNQDKVDLTDKLSQKEFLVASFSARAKSLLAENERILSEDARAELDTFNQVVDKYNVVKEKTASYKGQGVNVSSIEPQLVSVIDLILSKKYADADTLLTTLDTNLETELKNTQAAAVPKTTTTTTCSAVPSSGYCRLTINGFTVDVVAASVGSVWADTDNSNDCSDSCPTKSLSSYVSANGGYAGINGTYFCPPDYSSCAGKVNSYDFPVYNSNLSKWLNYGNILWDNRAMITFTSGGATFYPQAAGYFGQSVRAGIVNFPGLVYNGANIVGNYSLTSAQYTKGYRGGVAVNGGG